MNALSGSAILTSIADYKCAADAILSTNFPTFIDLLAQPNGDLPPHLISLVVDRLIQYHPPNFNSAAHRDLASSIDHRYQQQPPSEVMAALDLNRILVERPSTALVSYIRRVGAAFTRDEESCVRFLQDRPSSIQLSEEQVSNALWYATISQTPEHNPSVLVAGLRSVLPSGYRWQDVVSYFDQPSVRVSPPQFLRLYRALLPIARDDGSNFDIQRLWGGNWANADAHMSFIFAFVSQKPDQLDASTIPGLRPTFTLAEYEHSPSSIREVAELAVRHPLVSLDALSGVFDVALSSNHASQSPEAERLFKDVVVPNLHIFVVSAFGVPKPWPEFTLQTLNKLFHPFLYEQRIGADFALDSLWRKDKEFVKQRLAELHSHNAEDIPTFFEQAVNHGWLDDCIQDFNGFGLDLVAYGHGEGRLDLDQWLGTNTGRSAELARPLLTFLQIKAKYENEFQQASRESPDAKLKTTPLKIKTLFSFLNVLAGLLPPDTPAWIACQRLCMTAYPRLINYGGDYDDIIDANGKDGNHLMAGATTRMEDHLRSMYNGTTQVRDIVEALDRYKHSRDSLDQDTFSCMIHGLFDEYMHFVSYPIEALATTSVLFGGMISRKLIDGVPLTVALGMILEALREYPAEESMYKFGLQALMQLYGRFPEWPVFCRQLVQIPSLQATEAWRNADAVVNEEDASRQQNGGGLETLVNGNANESVEPQFAPFTSLNADPPLAGVPYEDPTEEDQDKIQFALNNMDQSSLRSRFDAIRESLERRHQQWFATHLVQERAKMQPNLHQTFLDLLKLFEDSALWAEIQRATFVCVAQMLNSESTMHSSSERAHLKNLGGWLGMLTLARDKPIRHQNIAFKQLLIEAHDTKRLVVVIPFVCKVLDQGKASTVFRPPNPWLMDIIHLLIELYHNADIKLNQKFEIEVLCKNLSLDHKSIEPSGEILNRMPVEEAAQVPSADGLDSFENLSLNGIGQGTVSNLVAIQLPDLGSRLNIPVVSEMVISNSRLRDIVHTSFNKALQDIINPVVDRSVTIAAISTQQMIRKDFATEPDETRVRNCAISMVKATAGSLALVTSKEPLRANFNNYMRQLSNDIHGGLPEGTIMMCVNSNLDLASGVIEEAAETRAVPEIEEMIQPELEARRRHRAQRPNQPYVDSSLNRWAMTMPDPYKMAPSLTGLNPEQMAIYEEFQRQPRPATTTTTPSHIASTSDATRSMANEVLQDQYSSLPSIPTPAETPLPQAATHAQNYSHGHTSLTNGRQPAGNGPDLSLLAQRTSKLLLDLQQAATDAPEDHYDDLPRGHAVLETMDALISVIIKARTTSEEFVTYVSESICQVLLGQLEDNLTIETFIHALHTLRRMVGPAVTDYAKNFFQRPDLQRRLLRMPLIKAFIGTEFLDWRTLDEALSRQLRQREQRSLELLDEIVDRVLLNDVPLALFANLGFSVEAAYSWVLEDPELPRGEHLKSLLDTVRAQQIAGQDRDERLNYRHEQIEYVFDEWVSRYRVAALSDKFVRNFLTQMQDNNIVRSKDDVFLFIRVALDSCVTHFEQAVSTGASIDDAYVSVDALVRLIIEFVKWGVFEDGTVKPAALLDAIWALGTMVVNSHAVKKAEMLNQRVFFRFFSAITYESKAFFEAQDAAPTWAEMLLKIASRLRALGPDLIPGFIYGWESLLLHRAFLPDIMKMEDGAGWPAYTALVKQLLEFVGEALKPVELSDTASKLYEATAKLLIVLEHDFPQYVAAQSATLLASIPPHCSQLINTVLLASSRKMPDPITADLNAADGETQTSQASESAANYLQETSLLDVVNSALGSGPSEDAVAHMTHAITRAEGKTCFGHAPIGANLAVIDAITMYIGNKAGLQQPSDPTGSAVATLSMLLHELAAEPRYYLILSMVNHLKSGGLVTAFFSTFLLHIFGQDLADPEDTEIREQIVRVLLERLIAFWPQPWGLLSTVSRLIREEQYMFFDLPFIKASPEVSTVPREAITLLRNFELMDCELGGRKIRTAPRRSGLRMLPQK